MQCCGSGMISARIRLTFIPYPRFFFYKRKGLQIFHLLSNDFLKSLTSHNLLLLSVDNFDADPNLTSEKNRIRILLYVKFCNKKLL
jgi:hypothetical protein